MISIVNSFAYCFPYSCFKGPLPHTAKHFWQMIWEQKTKAVIMLNRVVEKNQVSFMHK